MFLTLFGDSTMTSLRPDDTCCSFAVDRAGAGFVGAIGIIHLLVIHTFEGPKQASEQAAIAAQAANHVTPLAQGFGRQLTVLQLNTGYSVGMGLLGTTFAIIAILAVRAAPTLITRWSAFNIACTATGAFALWIAVDYFPEPVIAFFALGTACFAWVLVAGPRRSVLRQHDSLL